MDGFVDVGQGYVNSQYAGAQEKARAALLATPERVWTSLNDGTGSGLDADALDGVSSETFLLADAALRQRVGSLEGYVNGGNFQGTGLTVRGNAGLYGITKLGREEPYRGTGIVEIHASEPVATLSVGRGGGADQSPIVIFYGDFHPIVESFRFNRNGDFIARGHVYAHGGAHVGDVAEPVVGTGLAPGDVVVLDGYDALGKLRVKVTAEPFSVAVAGVVSSNPSVVLAGLPSDTPLAVSGIVPVKVIGPVAVGDLLATSGTPGHAMACKDAGRCFGATFGKATEAHAGPGAGTVRALVALG